MMKKRLFCGYGMIFENFSREKSFPAIE